MLIACITELDMTYEDAFTTLSKKFNMPLIEDILNKQIPLSDFFIETNFMDQAMIPTNKRSRFDNEPSSQYKEGPLEREKWAKPEVDYLQESPYIGKGIRKPYGRIYSHNMLLLENQSP